MFLYGLYRVLDILQEERVMRYFQTWGWNSKLMRKCKRCALFWQWVCGLFGHEISRTEWGYDGGDTADVWCRWCNKFMQVSKSELQFRLGKDKRGLLDMVEKETK